MKIKRLQGGTGRDSLEHSEQCALIDRVNWTMPDIAPSLFAVPNGGKRDLRTAARLKAEGVRPGVPDLFLALPRGEASGLWIELKRRRGGAVSPDQRAMIDRLRAAGYAVEVCAGADAAWATLCDYLDRDPQTGRQR